VSEDEGTAQQAHRPQRKQRAASSPEAQAALQLVETQLEAPIAAAEDDALPRRTRPRRRRDVTAPAQPLQLVETQPGSVHPDDPAAP